MSVDKNTYTYFRDSSQYYERVDKISSGKEKCYEITVLDGHMMGIKIFISDEERFVYHPFAVEFSMERDVNQLDEILAYDGLFEGKVPGVRETACGRVFVERLGGGQHMVICGAGHVSIALVRIAKMVGFKVTVIDDRPSFCNNARAAGADEAICEPFGVTLKAMDDSDAPYFVVVTRGHQYDVDCMHEILRKNHSYIGMMGSKVRVRNLKQGLIDEGFDEVLLDSVHMPIGLKIGAMTPEEIAVSIMAEVIQCRRSEAEDYHYSREMIRTLCDDSNEKPAVALATIVVKKGCGPREAGTKMLILEDGRIIGTIGGGCAEADVIQKARYQIRHKGCMLAHVDMTGREAAENGLVCGGIMDVFIQALN